jgi:hypothetical protein
MKSKETIQILSEIANSLDNYSLYKEATSITRVMTKLAQEESADTTVSDTTTSDTTTSAFSNTNPKPQKDREAYYKQLIDEYKQQLLSGRYTPERLYAHIYGDNSDPKSLYAQTVPKGELIEEQVEAFKKQFGRILRELQFETVDQPLSLEGEDKTKFMDASKEVHGMIEAYLRNRNLKIKDLENDEIKEKLLSNLTKQLDKKYTNKGRIDILRSIVNGYSYFAETKPSPTSAPSQGSTPPPGGGPGDVRRYDSMNKFS